MKAQGDVDARVHIFSATVLGKGRVANHTLDRFYHGKASVLILQVAKVTPGPVWAQKSEENLHPHRHPGSNPGRPTRSQSKHLLPRWSSLRTCA